MVEFFKSIYKDFEGDVRYFIKKYGDVISFTAKAIPVVGEVLSSGIKTAKEALASSENTLKEQKERISKAIVDSGKHLFVFIDDLDRLDKEELHTVFRLIRQVADFDNTIYVVAMDVDMASKSISHYYGSSSEDGRRFIDKIIQVPISLPVISKSVLNGWLEKSMRAIIASQTNIEDGPEFMLNAVGSPALAKGGSGDALTGILAALLWDYDEETRSPLPFSIRDVAMACLWHGMAGIVGEEKYGQRELTAAQLISCLHESERRNQEK